MKLLAFPRSSNPYQTDLYGAMAATRSLEVRYADGPTPSQTLNVLLLPAALAVGRARGARVFHLHWVYPFGLAWARRPAARRAVQWWFAAVLATAATLGYRIVWTAHNLLPHEQVFADDRTARRTLLGRCDVVIAHSDAVASILRGWGARRVEVVPAGIARATASAPTRSEACERLGLDPGVTRAVFFGQIREYKGVDVLIDAAGSLPASTPLQVVILGECPDDSLRRRLESAAAADPDRYRVRCGFVEDDELACHLAAADGGVFPFRAVTSSSSVGQALASGLPVVIPALATLDDVPNGAAIRYDPAGGTVGLVGALERLASSSPTERAAMRAAAAAFAARTTWPAAAASTWRVVDDLMAVPARVGARELRPEARR